MILRILEKYMHRITNIWKTNILVSDEYNFKTILSPSLSHDWRVLLK